MSYDLAVWDGDRPANDGVAAAEFRLLYARYVESGEAVPPTAGIAAYVAALLERFPDFDTDASADGPWSCGSLMGQASGPVVYLPMAWGRGDVVSAWAAKLAGEHGLNCYDPQLEQLRTPWGQPWRFELRSAYGPSFRDPDPDRVRKVVGRVGADDYFALLTGSDGWYVQVGYGERAGTRPGWYALERRDGTPDRHYRAEVTDVEEVVRAFVGFLQDDPTIAHRFPWRPYAL